MTNGAALLRKHNPILVLFPHSPKLARPGTGSAHARCGDYHPCNVEFFLENAHLFEVLPPYKLDLFGLLEDSWKPLRITGIGKLRERLASVAPQVTKDWVLDLARIPSQNPGGAWRKYRALLSHHPDQYKEVVYGRIRKTKSGTALQYWYFYFYNDFVNHHEGDWEMITIEVASDGQPKRVGVSAHLGGFWLPWSDVRRDGDHPIVHVARGSHAGYFAYSANGYRVDLVPRLNFPRAIKLLEGTAAILRRIQGWVFGWRDHPPADPTLDSNALDKDIGVRKVPELLVMPDDDADPDPSSDWWWLGYQGRWGSGHTRIFGTVGPDSPWGPHGQTVRWTDPTQWLRQLREVGID